MAKLINLLVLLYLHLYQIIVFVEADPSETQPLINFITAVSQVTHFLTSNWTGNDPCLGFWIGISCTNDLVYSLVLESMQLTGAIPNGTLSSLVNLRDLSLKNNSLTGSIPDLSQSRALRSVWLNQNRFSGSIPEKYGSTLRLKKLFLDDNNLSGEIPSSLASLPNLIDLHLENNQLTGGIPAFNQSTLQEFNVSKNQLSGEIPHTYVLQNMFPASSFWNNPELCGSPLLIPCSRPPYAASPPARTGPKFSKKTIIGIVVGDFAAILIITLVFFGYYRRKYSKDPREGKRSKETNEINDKSQLPSISSEDHSLNRSKLVFSDGGQAFDLEDLLRASAELLGKGSFGAAYKATLERAPAVTVKRLQDMNIGGKKEFEQQMLLLFKLKHPNLVALRSYYFARDEKLLIYDYMPNGSLFSLLHGNRGPGRIPLDWRSRLRIARCVARGLAYLHHECESQKTPHGNLKSSNVLIDQNMDARLSDYGLVPLMSPTLAAQHMVAFRAPEYIQMKKISHKADVFSFGVLLLELLTGKVPSQSLPHGVTGIDLPKWVNSVLREEWTAEVIDLELGTANNSEEEILNLLQLAMICVDASPDHRPKMSHVVRMVEDIREIESPVYESSIDSIPTDLTNQSTPEPSVSARRPGNNPVES